VDGHRAIDRGAPNPALRHRHGRHHAVVESQLKLLLNRAKSAVAPATKRSFLGFDFFVRDGQVRVRIDPKAREPVHICGDSDCKL
jgi:hypothetical protein